MRRAFLMAFAIACLAVSAAEAQRFTVTPKGKKVFADDIIEINFPTQSAAWNLSMSDSRTASNLEASVEYPGSGTKIRVQIRLRPIAPGPASFGPVDFFPPEGGRPVARLPKLEFDVLPALDDGVMPLADLFALQKKNDRIAGAVRAEIFGETRVGRPMIVRFFVYSEKPVGTGHRSMPRIPGAKVYEQGGWAEPEWVSIGGMLVMKRRIHEAIVIPEVPGPIVKQPEWADFIVNYDSTLGMGTGVARRVIALPPTTIAPRSAEGLPSGRFAIECPKSADRVSRFAARTVVEVRGDGVLSDTKLRLTPPIETPVLFGQPGLTEPQMNKGSIEMRGDYYLFASPIAKDTTEVAFPAVNFDYLDPETDKKASLSCRATTLTVPRFEEPGAPRRAEEAPDDAIPMPGLVIFFTLEVVAAFFVLGAALGLKRAISRP